MPNLNWSQLTSMQLGRYAEYYAKMEFTSYGFEVYTSEVDDHGVDFVAKLPRSNRFLEVQVKSVRDYKYTSIYKSKMQSLSEDRLICYLHFRDGSLLRLVKQMQCTRTSSINAKQKTQWTMLFG